MLLPGKSHGRRSLVGCSPWGHKELDMTEWLHFHFHFPALEKEMATHSSVLAWRIPGMVEPGELPSMGLHQVGHDWSDLAAAAAATLLLGFPDSSVGHRQCRRPWFHSWVGKICWARDRLPTVVFLGFPCSSVAMWETWVRSLGEDPLEEGKGYPLQYSGLENSMQCIVHEVAKSQT